MNTLDFLTLVHLSDSNLHTVATASIMGLVLIADRFYRADDFNFLTD